MTGNDVPGTLGDPGAGAGGVRGRGGRAAAAASCHLPAEGGRGPRCPHHGHGTVRAPFGRPPPSPHRPVPGERCPDAGTGAPFPRLSVGFRFPAGRRKSCLKKSILPRHQHHAAFPHALPGGAGMERYGEDAAGPTRVCAHHPSALRRLSSLRWSTGSFPRAGCKSPSPGRGWTLGFLLAGPSGGTGVSEASLAASCRLPEVMPLKTLH